MCRENEQLESLFILRLSLTSENTFSFHLTIFFFFFFFFEKLVLVN